MTYPLYADAKAEVEALGFTVVRANVPSSLAAAGYVVSIDPPVGTLLPPGSTVTLYVSTGPPPASRWTGSAPETVQAAFEAPESAALITMFVYLDVPGDALYASDAGIDIRWDGQTWLGRRYFGSIDAISESLELYAQPLKMTLSGVDPTVLAEALDSGYKGQDAKVYLGVLDPYTYALLDTPEEIYSGFMDVMTIEGDQNSGTVSVAVEHDLFRQPQVSRWTDEDQRLRFSGDLGFNHLHEIPGTVSKWGSRDVGYHGGPVSSGAGKDRGKPREF